MESTPERALCVLCETRPPRRSCPGIRGEICAPCCGEEREQTIDCPLECEYLREARRHEKLPKRDPAAMPHREIGVTGAFLEQEKVLTAVLGGALLSAALHTPGAIDADVHEAIDAHVRTLQTASSGLIYTTRPANPVAAQIQERFAAELHRFREQVAQRTGVHSIRDADVLRVLVFFRRVAWEHDNGRRRGRAFLDAISRFTGLPPGGGGQPVVERAGR
jgi:hypothetical protein